MQAGKVAIIVMAIPTKDALDAVAAVDLVAVGVVASLVEAEGNVILVQTGAKTKEMFNLRNQKSLKPPALLDLKENKYLPRPPSLCPIYPSHSVKKI